MTDGKTELYKMLYNHPSSDKTHDEILDELEERFKDYETMREVDYKELGNKKDKGEIDLVVPMEDTTRFYEVKSCAGLSDLDRAQEQIERQKRTFENQTENIEYWIRLGSLEIKYAEM